MRWLIRAALSILTIALGAGVLAWSFSGDYPALPKIQPARHYKPIAASAQARTPPPTDRSVVLLVFDGLPGSLIRAVPTPSLDRMARDGASTLAIGMIVTLRALLPIIIALPSGQLIDSIGPMRMLQFGAALLLLSLVNTVFAVSVPMLAVSQLLMGASIIIMAAAFQVLVSTGDRETRNKTINTYSMWMSGGGMVGPLIGGLISSRFSIPIEGYRFCFIAASASKRRRM